MCSERELLKERCEAKGFTFDSYSPGDGVTRYRFFRTDSRQALGGYFAGSGDFTALGWKEAKSYALGRLEERS